MNIDNLVTQYVSFCQALGEQGRTKEYLLRPFCLAVGRRTSVARIQTNAVSAFLGTARPVTMYWHNKYRALKLLFRFAVSRGYLTEAPLPRIVPKRPSPFVPYIYTRAEIRQLLDATRTYRRFSLMIEPETMRAILLLFYGTGLRVGEALRLTSADVDLPNAVLTVRETKFFKSRFVPFGSQVASILTAYANRRMVAHPLAGPDSRFFLGKRGAIHLFTLDDIFKRLREHAGVRRPDNARYQPRLHDIRHTFAVHRLTTWYQQGADVQRLINNLSVYLGHTELAATQIYLTMTPELLHQANARFEQYARGEGSHE
jgi:site-specific recombinase XerD